MYEDMPDPSSSKIARELLNEERGLYAHFHPVFTVIAPKEKVEALKSELVSFLESQGLEVTTGIVTKDNNFFEWK